jgi:DNA-binding NarL/FixJ family response regulator
MAHTDNTIRVLIVDDHPVVRTGLEGMLSRTDTITVIGEAENGEQAVMLAAERQPDVVLMDLRMPRMDGLEALTRIRQNHAHIQVIVLTTYSSDRDVVAAVNAGAIGYLLKDSSREQVIQAIIAAASGKSVLHPDVATRLVERVRAPSQTLLSERELEIMQCVSLGMTNKQIGGQLHISEATVKTHLLHIFVKLNVPDRAAAVRAAIEHGLINLDG